MPDVASFLLALLPIVALILALGVFKMPAHWATLGTVGLVALLAATWWKFDLGRLALAAGEGGILALWPIMIVILAAIFTYKLAESTGALETIKTILTGISADKRIQVLILAWGFGGFLEAVAGYGTAVAIPASILAMLGFNPIFAAVISLIANTVPTAFGAVGIPVMTLASITGLDPAKLSLAVGLQLTPFIVLIPFALVMLTGGGFKAIKGVFWITLASGLGFALPQLAAAAFLGPQLPALLGSISSMLVTIVIAKVWYKDKATVGGPAVSFKQGFLAWLPYILVFAFVLLASKLVPPVNEFLGHFKTVLNGWTTADPAVQLWSSEAAKPDGAVAQFFGLKLEWVSTPGVLIILAALIGSLFQGAKLGSIFKTFGKTAWTLKESTLTVVSILALAKIMDRSGMIDNLATVISALAGPIYPILAPLMGALGTFVTGSDTSSNVLFGKLQLNMAHNIGVDPYWLAGSNTAGATAGKMISPQSIAVATSATGLVGSEGKILGQTILFCLGYVVILGLMVFFLAPVARF